MFSTLKRYLLVAAVAVGSALLIAVRVLFGQNQKLKAENKIAKAKDKHLKKVMVTDMSIDEQSDIRLAKAVKELNDEGHNEELSDPNKDWNDS